MMKFILLFCSFFYSASGTQVVFKNGCGYEMSIVQTKDFDDPTLLMVLPSSEKRSHNFEEGNMNFRVGYNGTTRIEFWFNADGMDLYDVNIMTGFDVPVSIIPRKGSMVACLVSNCKQGVLLPHELSEKTHEMITGGKFIVAYCPRKRLVHRNRIDMKAGKISACKVCESPTAKSYHFGVKSCKACAAFFRRTIALKVQYQCRRTLECSIDHDKRYMCKLCRYNKCLRIGMMPELVESKGKLSERKNRTPEPEAPSSLSSIDIPSCSIGVSIEEVIAHYVKLESQLVDRRRITYNTSGIQDIIYNQKDCPYEMKDLKLFDWKTYIGCEQFEFAAVFDYARCFLQYEELNKVDQDNLYRLSCAVDVLMGMTYYTVREGLKNGVLINTNATYYPMNPLPPTGEEPNMANQFQSEDEHQRYKLLIGPYSHYWTTLILPMDKLDISFAEFALLKALVCWHICYYKFLTIDQEICTVQRNLIMKALLKLAEDRTDGCGVTRMGELLLYINSVFEHIYNLLESLYMMKVFNIVPLGDFVCDMLVLGR